MNARIGLISYGTDRPTSGITRYTQEMISAFRNLKLPLTVLHAGKVTKHNGTLGLRGAARAPALLTLGQAEIAWSAYQHELALLHDPTGMVPLFLSQARRVATIHDVIPYIRPETSTLMDWMIYRFWLPIAVRCLHRIITVSKQSKADIVRHLRVKPDRVSVVPQGVDRRYRFHDPGQTRNVLERYGIRFPYILYVSAVEPKNKRKNLPRLLEAFARLRRWSDRWRLVIVGARRKNYRPVYEAMEKWGLEQAVHFTGFVAEDDLPALYHGADIFVLPSLYEGFGFPVLEAMACGTPVITSNTSSLPEVAGDAAILIDPYSIEAIEDAMRRVLSNPDLADELSQKGLARAQEFSWERTARETIAVYEHVLNP